MFIFVVMTKIWAYVCYLFIKLYIVLKCSYLFNHISFVLFTFKFKGLIIRIICPIKKVGHSFLQRNDSEISFKVCLKQKMLIRNISGLILCLFLTLYINQLSLKIV